LVPCRIYNEIEFPTASAFGHTLAEVARMLFFGKKSIQGCGWKRPCLPAFEKAIGKETAAGIFLPFVSFSTTSR
jgi:hypothetical protein